MTVQYAWLKARNNASSTLDGAITDTDLTFSVQSGAGADFGTSFPMRLAIDSEIVEVASLSTDEFTISALTKRGLEGTTKVAHSDGADVKANVFASGQQQLQDRLDAVEAALGAIVGGAEGVLRDDTTSSLEVVATGTPGMSVNVGTGAAKIGTWPAIPSVAITAVTETATLSAPLANPRIDVVQLDQDSDVSVIGGTEGGTPVAPSVDADALALAQLYMRVGMTSIEDADDGTQGYITDVRVFL